jgi:bacteriocin-like protein
MKNHSRELTNHDNELTEDELAHVSGGIIAVLIGLLLPEIKAPPPAPKTP